MLIYIYFVFFIIEPPAVEDESRYHVFKLLQTQMQNYLLEEEMAMQQRIK